MWGLCEHTLANTPKENRADIWESEQRLLLLVNVAGLLSSYLLVPSCSWGNSSEDLSVFVIPWPALCCFVGLFPVPPSSGKHDWSGRTVRPPLSPWHFSMGFPANSFHEQCDPALLFQSEAEEVAAGTTWDVGAALCDVVWVCSGRWDRAEVSRACSLTKLC